MANTTKILPGRDFLLALYDNDTSTYKVAGGSTSHSIEIQAETQETTHKDINQGWASSEISKLSYTISAEAFYCTEVIDASTRSGYDFLFDAMVSKQPVEFKSQGLTQNYKGKVLITSLNLTGEVSGQSQYSLQCTGWGELVKDTSVG